MPLKSNLHATALTVGGKGVIVFGASGAGKSSLALELIREAMRDGVNASLVSDDRVDVALVKGRLIASPPAAIAGLVEVRGSGIHKIQYRPMAVLDLAVELVTSDKSVRYPAQETLAVAHGVPLPVLRLPIGPAAPQIRAILAHLGLYRPLGC